MYRALPSVCDPWISKVTGLYRPSVTLGYRRCLWSDLVVPMQHILEGSDKLLRVQSPLSNKMMYRVPRSVCDPWMSKASLECFRSFYVVHIWDNDNLLRARSLLSNRMMYRALRSACDPWILKA